MILVVYLLLSPHAGHVVLAARAASTTSITGPLGASGKSVGPGCWPGVAAGPPDQYGHPSVADC